jgi:glycosyltransferase involved in cell wall biosynthesis
MDSPDEIVIVDDYSSVPETLKILATETNVYRHALNLDYSAQKNYLNSKCTKRYIFQIDADELPSKTLLVNLKSILNENKQVELFWIPRENYFLGVEQNHALKWNWRLDDKQRINYPDYQGRVYKNMGKIKWTRKLHEHITNHETSTKLPVNQNLDLIHTKTIEKQVADNIGYNKNFPIEENLRKATW